MNGELDRRESEEPEGSQNGAEATGWLKLLAARPEGIWEQPSETSEETTRSATRIDPDIAEDGQPAEGVHPPPAPVGAQPPANEQAASVLAAGQVDETLAEERPVSRFEDAARAQRDEAQSVTRSGEDALNSVGLEELDTDELMWLDEMDMVPDMITNPWEEEDKEIDETVSEPAGDDDLVAAQEDEVDSESTQLESDEVPEDPDEAIAWLERLAARQGAPSEELSTAQQSGVLREDSGPSEEEILAPDLDAGEIPEDPDEAMAWLERLAARQGASADELPTVTTSSEITEPTPVVEPSMEDDEALVEPPLSEDLDQALGWLEELAIARASVPEEMPDEALDLVMEEPPTPAVAHDVEEAMAEADLLFTEPDEISEMETVEEAEEESEPEDEEDAMAWLEQLASRQGAPIEELTTVEGEPEDADVLEEAAMLASEQSDQDEVEAAVEVDESEEPALEVEYADEALPPEAPVEVESKDLAYSDGAAPDAAGDVPAEDMAWLDTLGAVDAEAWLETEAAVDEVETTPEPPEGAEAAAAVTFDEEIAGAKTSAGLLPEGQAAEELELARRAIDEGAVEEGLSAYASLVDRGELMPFLIDDLEAIYDIRGPEPALQRVLGDAYARNGQLQKALQAYREALDNL